MSLGPATLAWAAYAMGALMLVIAALAAWAGTLLEPRPVLYGEGAVAHAALLLREGSPYRAAGDGAAFVAANYPPLYFAVAAIGDPFVVGRIVSLVSTLSVAMLIGALAWPAGALAAAALALGWLALAPVMIWGVAVKPDLLALALTAGAAFALSRSPSRAPLAVALLAAAVATKPTALLPALALGVWVWRTDRAAARAAVPVLAGALVVGAAAFVALGPADVMRHLVAYNALGWSLEQAMQLALLGAVVAGVTVAAPFPEGAWRGAPAAYAVGALGVVALGGREGATINYLLDLTVAGSFALAVAAPRVRAFAAFPLAALTQLVVAMALLNPLGYLPGRAPTTGAWGDPARVAEMRILGGSLEDEALLVEDSGLLLAIGRRPLVDDLFLWSRLVERGVIDPTPLVARIRAREFDIIVSEVDLARLDEAPAYERQRWHPVLVDAVLSAYREARRTGRLFAYRP